MPLREEVQLLKIQNVSLEITNIDKLEFVCRLL